MKQSFLFRALLAIFAAALISAPAMAAETVLPWDRVYCFSPADFGQGDGVLLTQTPPDSLGRLMLGQRQIRAGDALTSQQLSSLTFSPAGDMAGDAVIECLRHTPQGQEPAAMTLKIRKNQPPTAEDSSFQTYKNIPGQVPLTIQDPEGEALTVTIVKSPRRGQAVVDETGAVTYTPDENKVGRDSFVYTVTDPAGNISSEATVRIEILRPSDRQTYQDMTGDPALLAATWLREAGIYSGEIVSGQLLFGPDKSVSRGEFLAMCGGLLGADPEGQALSSGFADQDDTPAWLGPYVTEGLRCGYLRGIPTDAGLVLDPLRPMTQAQAAQMVSSLLGISGSQPVMAQAESRWSDQAVAAMAETGIYTVHSETSLLTRRDAALMLYGAAQYGAAHAQTSGLLAWAEK